MKKLISIAAIAILAGSGAVFAHDKDLGANEDLYGSPLLDHDKGSAPNGKVMKGEGDQYASHLANPEDVTPNPNAKPEMPAPGEGWTDRDPEGYGINK